MSSSQFKKLLLYALLTVAVAAFLGKFVLDAYYIDNRPQAPVEHDGKIYERTLKVAHGRTVYLSRFESLASDSLVPLSMFSVMIVCALNMRWKSLATDTRG